MRGQGGLGERADTPFAPRYRAVTSALVCLVSIVAFEGLAISTIMPVVAAELDAAGAYALAFSAMFTAQLLGIVLARPWIEGAGAWPVMRAGQLLFALGSLVAGVAPQLGVFLVGRVLAGLGAGLVVVALYVLIGACYPPSLRPKLFGWISAAWVLPSIVGPLLAAAVSQAWSWRGVFLLVVPAVAATLVVLARALPGAGGVETRASADPVAPDRDATEAPRRVDARGEALVGLVVTVGAALFQWAGTQLAPPRVGPTIAAVGGIILLGVGLPRLLPAGALRAARGLPAVILARGLYTGAFSAAVAFVPLWLVSQRGMSTGGAGLVLAVASLGWATGAWVQGRERLCGAGPALVVAGAGCAAAGIAGYALLAVAGASQLWAIPAGALLGLGMGLGTTAQGVLILQLAPPAGHPGASSALMLADTLGSVLGVSITGSVYASVADRADVAFPLVWGCAAVSALAAVAVGRRIAPRHA